MTDPADRTAEQALVATSAANLKCIRKIHEDSLQAHALMKRSADNPNVIKFSDFVALRSLVVWGVDFDDWTIFKTTVLGFMASTSSIPLSCLDHLGWRRHLQRSRWRR